jgi:rubrerythrin
MFSVAMQKPGSSTIQGLGGLHQMSGWTRPIITDSGGFQAYSLIRQNPKFGKLNEQGLSFTPEGSDRKYLLTPEKTVQLQLSYGADIVVCLDDCTHVDASRAEQERSVERTAAWARRCREEFDRLVAQMQEFRDQEKEHEEWLEEQIRALGGDAHAETDKSQLIKIESQGIEKVVFEADGDVSHLFHAIFTAEMVDNAGWQLLLELADMADDDVARRAFSKRLHEEEDHLILMRRAVEGLARQEILTQQAPMAEVESSPQQ